MILWDEAKNKKLILDRSISFEEAAEIILKKKYVAILENIIRPNQMLFIIKHHGYIWAVPFVIDKNNNIIFKTIYPSRKFNKIYGGRSNEIKP